MMEYTTKRFAFITGLILSFFCTSMIFAQWTQWGGPNRDFKVETSVSTDKWPEHGPTKLWHRPLGTGYSAIVADEGVLYTMYRKKKTDAYEYTIALDAETGETLWKKRDLAAVPSSLSDHEKKDFTGPNATPLIVGDKLFTVGRNALLTCRRTSDGETIWASFGPSMFRKRPGQEAERVLRFPALLALLDINASGGMLIATGDIRRELFGRGPGAAAELKLSWLDWSTPRTMTPVP